MTHKHLAGWTLILAALGMTLGLLGSEVQSLSTWAELQTPVFIGKAFVHLATVIGAAVGGKLLPSE